jgi:hypothetical protein
MIFFQFQDHFLLFASGFAHHAYTPLVYVSATARLFARELATRLA